MSVNTLFYRVIIMLCITSIVCSLLSGCVSETYVPEVQKNVPCIGALDEPDPRFKYRVSTWNVVIAVVFFEILVPPIIVILNEARCPYALKSY